MFLRQHLRTWTTIALVLQSVWLLAIVPGVCCAAHEPAATEAPCHEEVKVEPPCSMHADTGAACPMHHQGEQAPAEGCTMRTACGGPMSALISMLALQGVLPVPQPSIATVASAASASPPGEQLLSRFIPPDSPPPRA